MSWCLHIVEERFLNKLFVWSRNKLFVSLISCKMLLSVKNFGQCLISLVIVTKRVKVEMLLHYISKNKI